MTATADAKQTDAPARGCPHCGSTSYTVLVVNQERWELGESSGQYECAESEWVEDLSDTTDDHQPVAKCAECEQPWEGPR